MSNGIKICVQKGTEQYQLVNYTKIEYFCVRSVNRKCITFFVLVIAVPDFGMRN